MMDQGLLTGPKTPQFVTRSAAGTSETVTPRPHPRFGPPTHGTLTVRVSSQFCKTPWFLETIAQILELLSLGDNWNGYGESAIHTSSVKRAVNVLDVIGSEGPSPEVVPTSAGGIQLEWVGNGFEIEVEIPPSGAASVFVVDPQGNETEHLVAARSKVWLELREHISGMGEVTSEPLPENPAHAIVKGQKPKGTRRKLRDASRFMSRDEILDR